MAWVSEGVFYPDERKFSRVSLRPTDPNMRTSLLSSYACQRGLFRLLGSYSLFLIPTPYIFLPDFRL